MAVQPAPQHSCMASEILAVVITYSSDWIKFAYSYDSPVTMIFVSTFFFSG